MEKNEDVSHDEFKIGIVGPISASEDIEDCYTSNHWISVRKIIQDSYPSIPMHLVSESNSSGIILDRIIQNLAEYDLIICDTSSKNPNVMFELGLRLAFDKPVILVKDELTAYSFDISLIEHVDYTSNLEYSSMLKFQTTLSNKIKHIKNNGLDSFLSHFPVTSVNNTLPKIEVSGYDAFKADFEKLLPLLSETKHLLAIENKNRSFNADISTKVRLPTLDEVRHLLMESLPPDAIKEENFDVSALSELVINEFRLPPLNMSDRRKLNVRIINALGTLGNSLLREKIE